MAMAIELECASVIVPIRALEERYPGGLTTYRDDCPNNSYLQDENLTLVGFRSTAEAEQYLGQVALSGLRVTDDPFTSDALIICRGREPILPCNWLVTGEHDGVMACWLRESPPGQLVRWRECPIYRCPGLTLRDLPRIFQDARFTCRPLGSRGDRLVCERGGHRIDVEILGGEDPNEDGFIFLISQHGRVAGVPDDEGLIREVDSLLKHHGLSGPSAG
jgi:hypothetical protein